MIERRVGVLGARSLVGKYLLSRLIEKDWQVNAYSRNPTKEAKDGVIWRRIGWYRSPESMPFWISLAPIWVLPDLFPTLEASGVKRFVVLSSTSRFTKEASSDVGEQLLSKRLADAEKLVISWAEERGIEWIILRPTLIYGLGRDGNISEIAHFIKRYHFFPLLGRADGLRQPVYANDVAQACVAVMENGEVSQRSYNLSGGETLTYRAMVGRVFHALRLKPRWLHLPLPLFRMAILIIRQIPRYRNWTPAMAERMNRDLVFDHSEAESDFEFRPRAFVLTSEDLPRTD
ncbi:MAG: NAD-dependent epimerase/dehydratase family protein [Candidatus Thiodiazotropha sp. (ex Myrtea sp. 'scaly one' KF741663)]|nr:NAD-dependent epimerase/dehydratase family protein [Candidatus Thiodiazotropha sp. (ex Myrtea sp. 'scaly one' KF741663)]